MSSSQVVTAGHNSAATLSCSAGCSVVTGITSFPADSVPLWQTTFTANVWDAIGPGPAMDKRAIYSRNVVTAGAGVLSAFDPTTGIQTVSTDPLQVPRYFANSGAPSCQLHTAGRDFYKPFRSESLLLRRRQYLEASQPNPSNPPKQPDRR